MVQDTDTVTLLLFIPV